MNDEIALSAVTPAMAGAILPPAPLDPSMSCDSVPDFAVLCSFLDRFGPLLGIQSSIKEVEIMLEQQGNVSEQLIDIHIKLLRKIVTSATKNRFDRYLARFCEMYLVPYNHELVVQIMEHGYGKLDLASKVHILKSLLEMQFDFNSKFKSQANERPPEELRIAPLGRDADGIVYWLQVDEDLNVRLYTEDLDDESSFHLLHKTKEELAELLAQLKKLKDDNFQKPRNVTSSSETSPKSADDAIKQEDQKSIDVTATLKPDVEVKTETPSDEIADLKPPIDERVKKEVQVADEMAKHEQEADKKELVEDLCPRQSDSSRLSGESHPASAKAPVSKLENEAHCPQSNNKTEALNASMADGGRPEAAHSASASSIAALERAGDKNKETDKDKKKLTPGHAGGEQAFDEECEDAKATDLSLPHLPTPPHEQEQRLPAAPQTAVHSPPVPPKKPQRDGEGEDDKETTHDAAEDLRTSGKKTTAGGGDAAGRQGEGNDEGTSSAEKAARKKSTDGKETENGQKADEKLEPAMDDEEPMDISATASRPSVAENNTVQSQRGEDLECAIEAEEDGGDTEDNDATNDASDVQQTKFTKEEVRARADVDQDGNSTQPSAEVRDDEESTERIHEDAAKGELQAGEERDEDDEEEEEPKPRKRGR
ncbi:hypothetical protein BIW11_13306, partial [Tropilaelaps mercedesae]